MLVDISKLTHSSNGSYHYSNTNGSTYTNFGTFCCRIRKPADPRQRLRQVHLALGRVEGLLVQEVKLGS